MMQDELRQALAVLMPPPAPVATNPPATAVAPVVVAPVVVAPAANPPAMDALPANNDNAGGQPLNVARGILDISYFILFYVIPRV